MARVRLLDPRHAGAENRQREPERHLPLKHAARVCSVVRGSAALARNDQRVLHAVTLRALEEMQERSMRLALRHSVQIDAGVNLRGPGSQTLPELAIESNGL